jgi:hypothetical protein
MAVHISIVSVLLAGQSAPPMSGFCKSHATWRIMFDAS